MSTFVWVSCGSVAEHCVSSAKGCGFIPREHTYWQKCITWMHCKSLWIKVFAKCMKNYFKKKKEMYLNKHLFSVLFYPVTSPNKPEMHMCLFLKKWIKTKSWKRFPFFFCILYILHIRDDPAQYPETLTILPVFILLKMHKSSLTPSLFLSLIWMSV